MSVETKFFSSHFCSDLIRNTSKKMAVDINWKTFLTPDSSLPPDVTFLVKGEDDEEKKVPALVQPLSPSSIGTGVESLSKFDGQ